MERNELLSHFIDIIKANVNINKKKKMWANGLDL